MGKHRREVVTHTFKGKRFDDNGVDLDVLPDLLAYKNLLVDTAKELWRRKHPQRERLPKNFEDSLVLKFYEVQSGSACIPLEREVESRGQTSYLQPERDELDEAVGLVADLMDAAAHDRSFPPSFPKTVIPMLGEYGKTLRDNESIEHRIPGRAVPVRYTKSIRERIMRLAEPSYEDSIDVIGTVTMARVTRPRMAVMLDDGREVEAAFRAEDEDAITTALKDHLTAKVRVQGRGQFSPNGQMQRIVDIDGVMLVSGGDVPHDTTFTPIWEIFQQIMREVPTEQLDRLPEDAAANHDHYIYGTSKRTP